MSVVGVDSQTVGQAIRVAAIHGDIEPHRRGTTARSTIDWGHRSATGARGRDRAQLYVERRRTSGLRNIVHCAPYREVCRVPLVWPRAAPAQWSILPT